MFSVVGFKDQAYLEHTTRRIATVSSLHYKQSYRAHEASYNTVIQQRAVTYSQENVRRQDASRAGSCILTRPAKSRLCRVEAEIGGEVDMLQEGTRVSSSEPTDNTPVRQRDASSALRKISENAEEAHGQLCLTLHEAKPRYDDASARKALTSHRH